MFSMKSIKMTSIALASLMTFGVIGATASVSEAASLDRGYEVQELASHRRHNDHDRYDEHRNPPPRHEKQTSKKKYSEGERNTAALLGAVVGAIIAKNT